ncbi:restriction endonuclease subunit S [Planomonospora sp. ID82291]|uniref:restriction endonuclease subunit S n=1 Tax=Planomonospora sp. ID82291 TaxID=2738136 RepID=UPI0018C3BD8A|nr:restriction endonuclease subunit S [Planomonospora sp. ID82291]MBG0814233.1 restriction endonuclease subunit S [Planomonospora sp. ID82291]
MRDHSMGVPNNAGWPEESLQSLCKVISRGTAPSYVDASPVLAIGQRCVQHSGFDASAARPHDKRFKRVLSASPGDVLLNSTGTGTIGRSCVFDQPGDFMVDSHVTVLRGDRAKVDPRWVEALLRSQWGQKHLESHCYTGSTNQIELSRNELLRTNVLMPPIEEQGQIADILDTVDTYVDASNKLIAKLSHLGIALQDHLFESQEWPTVRLDEICRITSGTTPLRAEGEKYFTSKGVPWVKTLDLNESTVIDTNEKVTPEAIRALKLRILPPGTVLVAMYGGWEQIGRTALLGVSATINQAICALEADDRLLPEFLLRVLQQRRGQWRKMAASTRKDPNITKSDVHAFQVPMPPIQNQEYIVKSYASHLGRVANEIRSKNRLEIFKQGLMNDLLTGRVRVSEAEAVLEEL